MFEDQVVPTQETRVPGLVERCRALDPDNIYEAVLRHPQLVQIAAPTGRGKTMLLINIGMHAAALGRPVLWIGCDRPMAEYQHRLWCIWHGVAPSALLRMDLTRTVGPPNWFVGDLPQNSHDVACHVRETVRKAPPGILILIDGFDLVYSLMERADADALTAEMAAAAARLGSVIVVTSQVGKDVQMVEVVAGNQLAFSNAKTHPAGAVLTLGARVMDEILTICIPKDSQRVFGARRVRRLHLDPSLRLLPEPNVSMIDAPSLWANEDTGTIPRQPPPPEPSIRVGERPGDFGDPAGDDDVNQITSAPDLRVYNGSRGFIPLGRGMLPSPTYMNRDFEAIGILIVFYEHAAAIPKEIYAPKTKIALPLKRGQFMTSLTMLAKELGLKRKRVETLLERFEREGLIRQQLVAPDGTIMPVETGFGTGERSICRVITLCHYSTKDEPSGEVDGE